MYCAPLIPCFPKNKPYPENKPSLIFTRSPSISATQKISPTQVKIKLGGGWSCLKYPAPAYFRTAATRPPTLQPVVPLPMFFCGCLWLYATWYIAPLPPVAAGGCKVHCISPATATNCTTAADRSRMLWCIVLITITAATHGRTQHGLLHGSH